MRRKLRAPVFVLTFVIAAFLWQHRAWFPGYRHWQVRSQVNWDLEKATQQEDPASVKQLLDQRRRC